MKLSLKQQKLILFLLLIAFTFGVGFLAGSKVYTENPIIIQCNE